MKLRPVGSTGGGRQQRRPTGSGPGIPGSTTQGAVTARPSPREQEGEEIREIHRPGVSKCSNGDVLSKAADTARNAATDRV